MGSPETRSQEMQALGDAANGRGARLSRGGRSRFAAVVAVFLSTPLLLGAAAPADKSTEPEQERVATAHPYRPPDFSDPAENPYAYAETVVGKLQRHRTRQGDLFVDLARHYGVGFDELVQANRLHDPWVIGPDRQILIPTAHVLPKLPRGSKRPFRGLVINVPELRIYYYTFHTPANDGVMTFPVGLGRYDWQTPVGKFYVLGKKEQPTWKVPNSIKQEWAEDEREILDEVPPGPDNPLGEYWITLSIEGYGIHGTNGPDGVGRMVSHGCIRLYPEDIAFLFPRIKARAKGMIVYQPIKVGARDGKVFIEVHRDIYGLDPDPLSAALELLSEMKLREFVDAERLIRALDEKQGIPVEISRRNLRLPGERKNVLVERF